MRGAGLKNRHMLKGPRRLGESPPTVVLDDAPGGFEIRGMICSEIKSGRFDGFCTQQIQEFRLEETIFVMTFFRPRIRKEDKYIPEHRPARERFQK